VAAFGALASAPFIAMLFGPDYGPSVAASQYFKLYPSPS